MEEPMVSISLREYNELRDKADYNRLLYDRMLSVETRMMDMVRRICDLECRNK